MATRGSSGPEALPLGLKLVYGAPSFAGAAMVVPILVHLPKFYADVVLVPLGYLAVAIAIARSLDALSDPFVGWLSDRTRSRWGRRRPFMAVGAPLCALAFWALFSPPRTLSGPAAGGWFGVTFVFYFFFHTLYVLPHHALGPELTLDYHERSVLFGVREAFGILGTIVAAVAPGLLLQRMGDERRVFAFLGALFGILLVLLYTMLVVRVRERPDFVARAPNPFVPGVRRALRNRPFRILLATYVVASVTGAIPGTLMPFFNAYVIRPANPALWLSIFLTAYFGAGLLCLPLWVAAARRFGKRPAWLASFVMGTTGGGAMFFLGEGDTLPLLFLIGWAGSSFGAGLFLAPAMQADVIDYDELHTGRRREAQYTAFWTMWPKFVAIPSAAVPIAILASLGYVPNVVQTPAVVLAIKSIFALTPATFAILAFAIAWRFPIDEPAHRAILAAIERHARGEDAVDPLTHEVLPPPSARAVDEPTAWFLDYFSARELRRFLGMGPGAPVRDVRRAALMCGMVSVGAGVLGARSVTNLAADPGPVGVLAIVLAGFALAVACFHLLRLGAAHRLAAGAVPAEVIRRHLGPAAGPGPAVVPAVPGRA
jgi:GPH family glycoside/pentoside/hexuronide:cation symporter